MNMVVCTHKRMADYWKTKHHYSLEISTKTKIQENVVFQKEKQNENTYHGGIEKE